MKIIPILLVLAFLMGCSENYQRYNIADVTKPETIKLKKASSQGNIYSLTVVGKGYLDGTAEIVLFLNGEPYKTENLSKDTSFKWLGDWYSDSAKIEYNPSSVKRGNLSLQYKFEDI